MITNADNETLSSHKLIEDRFRYFNDIYDTLGRYDYVIYRISEVARKPVVRQCGTLKDYINDDYLYFGLAKMVDGLTRFTERLMAVTRTKKSKGSKII